MKIKFLVTTLLFSLIVFFAGGVVQVAHAQMVDEEVNDANKLGGGSLDFSQTIDTSDISIFADSESTSLVEVKKVGTLGFQYQSSYQFDSGDESFCQNLHLKITREDKGETLYDDLLNSFTDFSASQRLLPDSLFHSLQYHFSLENSAPTESASCQFLIKTVAWQLGQADYSHGFFDLEQTLITLTYDPSQNQEEEPPVDNGEVVINEVYEDGTNGLEWVELYNNNSQPISLGQWSIKDKTDLSIDTLPDISIAGKSFVVIVTSGVDSTLLTSLTNSGVEVIQLDNANIGNGLNAGGDELYLKNNLNEVIDSLSWGVEDGIFALPNLLDDESYSRIVTGVDTDSQLDWERLQTPSPGS